ncbi:transcription repressor NadR [Paenisporosarcina cavernae]|uniref:Transcription repressor NadR n=1 Tax=Paenisporosarcina cavernae TaxID=2320858 RepID=A0A385YSD2_9BACL|nr:transcription repressor NadR [Paenisporosarcina cavernae]AYC29735.1 transcription repressor NadR [Paenisporosarcina cavernae]
MKKKPGDVRREKILEILTTAVNPIKGVELATQTGVSRQIIVGDITLLKAKDIPIVATSQGYILLPEQSDQPHFVKQIACHHGPADSKEELYTLVDAGVTVMDVTVEHPVYGEINASIMVSNRVEVDDFIREVEQSGASFLSELTGGIHLHKIAANKEQSIHIAIKEMRRKGFLAEDVY